MIFVQHWRPKLFHCSCYSTVISCVVAGGRRERELVTGNEEPRIVARNCIIKASIGKRTAALSD
jgi:hypothetical protein